MAKMNFVGYRFEYAITAALATCALVLAGCSGGDAGAPVEGSAGTEHSTPDGRFRVAYPNEWFLSDETTTSWRRAGWLIASKTSRGCRTIVAMGGAIMRKELLICQETDEFPLRRPSVSG